VKSQAPNRFGTFFSRVETERMVLSIINDMANGSKLHGLTSVAIERWAGQLGAMAPLGSERAGEVVRLLHRIAVRANAHADQSRVVFADEANTTLPVHDLVEKLRVLCVDRFQASSPSQAN